MTPGEALFPVIILAVGIAVWMGWRLERDLHAYMKEREKDHGAGTGPETGA